MMLKSALLIGILVAHAAYAFDLKPAKILGGTVPKPLKLEAMKMLKEHMDLSVKYLYTSTGFGNQFVERPGMANELKEQSDSHWEDGVELLKKYLQRGGDATDLNKYFKFQGKNQIASVDVKPSNYLATINEMLTDSKSCHVSLTMLNKIAKSDTTYAPDWLHYLEEKIDNEAGRTREMKGHVTVLSQMLNSGMALHFFDKHI